MHNETASRLFREARKWERQANTLERTGERSAAEDLRAAAKRNRDMANSLINSRKAARMSARTPTDAERRAQARTDALVGIVVAAAQAARPEIGVNSAEIVTGLARAIAIYAAQHGAPDGGPEETIAAVIEYLPQALERAKREFEVAKTLVAAGGALAGPVAGSA